MAERSVQQAEAAASRMALLRSILLLIFGLLLFSCMDSTVKYLATRYNAPLVVAIRYIVHCLLMVVFLAPVQGVNMVRTKRTGWVLVRGACLMAGSLCMGLALQRMPVAESTALVYTAPLMVTLLARPLLGETIRLSGWLSVAAGLCGVLLIARPGSGLDVWGVVLVLFAAGMTAAYQMLSRYLSSTESAVTLLFYSALIGAIGFGIFLPWSLSGESPDLQTVLLFLSMGVTGGLGHYFFTAAYRHAPASTLAPVTYMQLIWAGLLGWLFFSHMPDALSIVGMCVIAGSGLLGASQSVFATRRWRIVQLLVRRSLGEHPPIRRLRVVISESVRKR